VSGSIARTGDTCLLRIANSTRRLRVSVYESEFDDYRMMFSCATGYPADWARTAGKSNRAFTLEGFWIHATNRNEKREFQARLRATILSGSG